MIQPYDLPERLMGADPDYFIRFKLAKTEQGLSFFGKEALAEYIRCFRNPATIHAMCEDYRATYGVDFEMDKVDFAAGRKIACPALILWGATGAVGRNHKPAEVWANTPTDIRGAKALPCGTTCRRRRRRRPTRSCARSSARANCDRSPHERSGNPGRPEWRCPRLRAAAMDEHNLVNLPRFWRPILLVTAR